MNLNAAERAHYKRLGQAGPYLSLSFTHQPPKNSLRICQASFETSWKVKVSHLRGPATPKKGQNPVKLFASHGMVLDRESSLTQKIKKILFTSPVPSKTELLAPKNNVK